MLGRTYAVVDILDGHFTDDDQSLEMPFVSLHHESDKQKFPCKGHFVLISNI